MTDVQPAATNTSAESPPTQPAITQLGAIEERLSLQLDSWQREFVLADEPQLILCCGRKSGKTTAIAVKIVRDALTQDFSKSDGILILSRGQRQSREVFLVVRAFLARMGIVFAKEPQPGEAYASMTMLRLPNGNKIYSLPCGYDGVTLRYYSFWKVYRDEDAFIPDAVDTAVGACLAVHGVQEIRASTPAGTQGSFYNAWHNPDFRRWHRRTEQCSRVPKLFLLREKRRMSRLEYSQEYEAEFTDVAEGLYSGQLIAQCSSEINLEEVRKQCRAVFIGVDFARFGDDENAIAVAYLVDKRLHVRIEVIRSKWRTTQVVGRINAIIRQEPHFRVVVTDEGGVGAGATDMLIEQHGRRKVIGVTNQKRVQDIQGGRSKYAKVDMHSNLQRMMENGLIVFDDDIAIVRSLRSMQFKYTLPGDLTIFGRDSHVAEAVVRAAFPMMGKQLRRSIVAGVGQSATEEIFGSEDIEDYGNEKNKGRALCVGV